jgi:insertion element IS1 protein InsB
MKNNSSCYYCGSTNIVKNGKTYYGKSRGKCKVCGKQFVFERKNHSLTQEQKRGIELLLLERISLEGICRALEISPYHLYAYLDELYREVPENLYADSSECKQIHLQVLACESDELWSFVAWKANKQWIWVAQDRQTKHIIAVYVGSRGAQGAMGLWQAIDEKYKQRAVFYTDDWDAYKQIIPTHQHRICKTKKETNHIERFFCTLRQRVARLVRLSLSFSKKLERHIQAIRFFVAYYNLSLLL